VRPLGTIVLAEGFFYVEAPRWRDDALWMSDTVGGKFYRLDLAGRAQVVADVPQRPAGLAFLPDRSLLIASVRDRCILRLHGGKLEQHASLGPLSGEPGDMVVDEAGRAYIATFSFASRSEAGFDEAAIVMMRPDGSTEIVARGFEFPNGCAILAGERRLVVAETFGQRLTCFSIAGDGRLVDRRIFAQLDSIAPDGICLDQDGAVWMAASGRSEFLRVVEGGRITHRVETPGRQAVACALGGLDGRTLFCLTVAEQFEDVPGCPATARVDIAKVAIPAQGTWDA